MSNSEKIEQIRFRADVADAEGMIEVEQFLAEYADLLEAIDKAEPVAELVNEYSEGHGYLCRHIKLLDMSLPDGTKFYTHPPKQEQSPKGAPTVAIDERVEFEKVLADEMPSYQRQNYSADDVETNVRQVAWDVWQAARKLSAPEVVSKTTNTIAPDDYTTPIPHDEKRIDFLEAHPELRISKHKRFWNVGTFSNYERDVHRTLREAIDAAMLKGEKCQ